MIAKILTLCKIKRFNLILQLRIPFISLIFDYFLSKPALIVIRKTMNPINFVLVVGRNQPFIA